LSEKPQKLVFIAHSSKDKPFVEKLAHDLKRYKLPLWFDKWELKVGDSIVEKINSALGKMTDLIIVLSPNSVNANWVRKELSSALMRKLKDNSVRILPILKEECEIPTIINDILYANFASNYDDGFLDLIDGLGLTMTQSDNKLDVRAYVKALMYHSNVIEKIQDAGKTRKLLWIEAREEDGSVEPRVGEPYSFRDKGKDDNLLFYAWDVRRNGIRAFRVDRIIDVKILEETFKPRFPVEF